MEAVTDRPDLSVIVVTHERLALALDTLRAARAAAAGLRVEWHVVDTGSREPVVETIRAQWPDIDVRAGGNAGFAAANNDALSRARGRYVLLLNPDVEIATGRLRELVDALDDRPSIGMASVLQLGPDGTLDLSMRRDPRPLRTLAEAVAPGRMTALCGWGEIETRTGRYRSERRADWVCGAFLIARAQTIGQVGPLDERFFLYSEETDWCYRCRAAGWGVAHLPLMQVIHHRNRIYSPELLAQLSHSRVMFARKHRGARGALAMRMAIAVRHALRAAAFGLVGRGHPHLARRARAEARALGVVIGFTRAPFQSGPA